jgi:hypothetical protein
MNSSVILNIQKGLDLGLQHVFNLHDLMQILLNLAIYSLIDASPQLTKSNSRLR